MNSNELNNFIARTERSIDSLDIELKYLSKSIDRRFNYLSDQLQRTFDSLFHRLDREFDGIREEMRMHRKVLDRRVTALATRLE